MINNREIYLRPAYECDFNLQCSACSGGVLKVKKGTVNKRETNASKAYYDFTGEVYEDESSRFCLLLECKNCEEIFCVAGTVSLKEYRGDCGSEACYDEYIEFLQKGIEDLSRHYHSYYSIKFIDPQIDIFKIQEQVPDEIKNNLLRSFSLFWGDKEASANKVRAVLELLMDHFEISKTDINKKGKEYKLSLNSRLNLFRSHEHYGYLVEKLIAIKFLGNAGSHMQPVTKEDLLDAYEIIEYVLEECFQRQERAKSLIEKSRNLENKYSA